ncbi:MAG: hypothetical protein JXM73_12110, partial [Anaerolineae bacterium]|nr:hypothetical protein [Anaerolineae bacterium]
MRDRIWRGIRRRSMRQPASVRRLAWWPLLALAVLAGYWLLPISGQVIVIPGERAAAVPWPQMHLSPAAPHPGQEATLRIADATPWVHVLLTVNGHPLQPQEWTAAATAGDTSAWQWTLTVPESTTYTLVFYRDCHMGCIERGRMVVGPSQEAAPQPLRPIKLGVVFADPQRDWHGRSAWDVELTYAALADQAFWGIDDLATRVHRATASGLRVLVRVDYAQGQSLPPADDQLALAEYLFYLQRLARDQRLREVYGYLLGSGFNELSSNAQAPDRPVTPEWYARLFNGYGEPVTHADNAVQVIRAENPHVRVLVGPVRPWNGDQDGSRRHRTDAPWLNYMNTLVYALDSSARLKSEAGIPLAAPDGFALHAPGRPSAPELRTADPASEPRQDLPRDEWNGAQAGFRVYRDMLDVINAHSSTRGLPVYITSTNTSTSGDDIPPAQNYPQGWLTAAFQEINNEPQVHALCWFLDADRSGDTRWNYFSLAEHPGRLV